MKGAVAGAEVNSPAVKQCRRTFEAAFYLWTGVTPWGRKLAEFYGKQPPSLTRSVHPGERPQWIICCGVWLWDPEVDAWLADGLAAEGSPGRDGRRTIVATDAMEAWISGVWHDMTVRSWGARQRPAAVTSPLATDEVLRPGFGGDRS